MGYKLIKVPQGSVVPQYGNMDTFTENRYFLEEACESPDGRYYKNPDLFKEEKNLQQSLSYF